MRTCVVLAATVAAISLLASCGGGGSDGPAPGPSPSPPPGGAASTTISIVADRGAQSFDPNPATASQGQTVAWRNTDAVVHRIVSNDGLLDTGNISPGATSSALPLTTDGTNYHCTIHPGMIGSVNRASGTPPPCTGIYC